MKSKKTFIFVALLLSLLCICSFAILPLFHSGFFPMHDDEQIARLSQMYLVLSQGQIPPRWIPDLGFGFGYPLFNFYPPLVYYLGSIFHLIGFSFIDSTKIIMGFGFFLSAGTMFVWVKKHYGVVAGFFAAILYTYAPYHSVDLYVRGALSEFFSWIWIPIIFWSLDMLFEKLQKKFIVLFGLFMALLMLSHTLVMLQFAPFVILYILFLFMQNRNNFKKKVLFVCFGFLLGLGLSAYFWLPSIAEKQYTLVDTILTKELANYAIHFVCPEQLWNSPWGYGGSVAGCVDGLTFQIGKIQYILGIAGFLISIFFVFKKRKFLPLSISALLLCSVFMTLTISKPIWDFVKPFWYIQFPWRYLLFVAVGCAFLGGFVLSVVEKRFGKLIAVLLGILLISLSVFQVRNYFRPQQYLNKTDSDYTSKADLQWRVSSMSYEYVPQQVPTKLSVQNTTELNIGLQNLPTQSFATLAGDVRVTELENKSQLKKYRVSVYNTKTYHTGIFQVNTFNFPGWEIFVNGQKYEKRIKNYLDLIQIELPSGQYTVIAQFTDTPIRSIANGISLLTLFTLLLGMVWTRYKKL